MGEGCRGEIGMELNHILYKLVEVGIIFFTI